MAFPYAIMVFNLGTRSIGLGDTLTPQASMTEILDYQYLRQGGTMDFETGDTIEHRLMWQAFVPGGETMTMELYDIDTPAVIASAAITNIWSPATSLGHVRGDSIDFTLPGSLVRVRARYTLTGSQDAYFISIGWYVRKVFG